MPQLKLENQKLHIEKQLQKKLILIILIKNKQVVQDNLVELQGL